jgi:phage shock protein A
MVTNPFIVGFYARTNQRLIARVRREAEETRERWQDEAREAALAGRPGRAGYIEHMTGRLLR